MAEKTPTTTSRLKPERVQQKLKSERVQGQLRPERVQARMKPERIQAGLKELPGWELAGDGRALERTYLFPTIRAAVAFVALVAEIGEAEGYVPDVLNVLPLARPPRGIAAPRAPTLPRAGLRSLNRDVVALEDLVDAGDVAPSPGGA